MTTTIESTETNNKQGLTLNEDQLNNLMSLTGMSEETISEMLGQFIRKFISEYITFSVDETQNQILQNESNRPFFRTSSKFSKWWYNRSGIYHNE